MNTVLVTGGSGFLGSHVIVQLLNAGHTVRTTVRNLSRQDEVLALVRQGGADPDGRLSFFKADLMDDAGWAEASAGCDFVHHVASPFPSGVPKNEDELIVPARDGALRALKAARAAGVKRVVLTSSFAAIGYGQGSRERPFDETDWTNLSGPNVRPYVKSKTIAERAAWDYVAGEGKGLELAVVNPVGIFGPVLGKDHSTSTLVVERMLKGDLPGMPKMAFGVVDVRDVADLHLRCMSDPKAAGERFLALSGDFITIAGIARILKENLGEAAAKVPTRELPNGLVRLVALFDGQVRQIVPDLGRKVNGTSAKAQKLLGWTPRSREEAVLATARSMIELGLV